MNNRFDAISPLDYRFIGGDANLQKALGPYLSGAAVIRYQARVEGALALAMADAKIIDRQLADQIASAADQVTPQEVFLQYARAVAQHIRPIPVASL